MIRPASSELLVRAVALYVPILATLALALHGPRYRRRATGALLATAWNAVSLLVVNAVALRAGWWRFDVDAAGVAGVPADLWLGWSLLWGAVPVLATRRIGLAVAVLVGIDVAFMPLGEPVVVLHGSWLVGEAVAAAMCLVPGLVLARWTIEQRRVHARAALQVVAFGTFLLFVVPSLAFAATGEDWSPLLQRPRWQLVAFALVLAPAAAMALQAVRELADHGGTPVPLDPPPVLVTTGPYAYVANPMQLGGTLLLAGWGVVLASPAIVAAALMAAAFSAGPATWTEDRDLFDRFGADWRRYRAQVPLWRPRWRPAVEPGAVVHVAMSCPPCRQVGSFLGRRRPRGLAVEAAESSVEPLRRITYRSGAVGAVGVAAVGRSLEHVHLGWAAASWVARLPGVEHVLQLVTDAIGGGPRAIGGPRAVGGPVSPDVPVDRDQSAGTAL